MIDPSKIEEFATKFGQSLPSGAKSFQQDIEKNFKHVLQSMLSKLDLVTREEFDVQKKVLARTRDKIDALEKAVAEMEKQ